METDSSPQAAREAVEKALARLGVEHIDLFYVHRLDNGDLGREDNGGLG